MDSPDFSTLHLTCDGPIASVRFDHPPLNLLDAALMGDLGRLLQYLNATEELKVAVFESAHPDFFIAHADVELIRALPSEAPPRSEQLSFFHQLVEGYRQLPLATIGLIEGIARGGGSEFLLSLDMRFGAIGRCLLGQPEVALGILPGGSGTQRLGRLMGRGRTLEAVLGCGDFDAETAERYGWINRALPAEKVRPFVRALAERIASFPREAIVLAKGSVDAALERDTREGLLEEADRFNQSAALPEARRRMARFLEIGGQTPEGERDLGALWRALDADS